MANRDWEPPLELPTQRVPVSCRLDNPFVSKSPSISKKLIPKPILKPPYTSQYDRDDTNGHRNYNNGFLSRTRGAGSTTEISRPYHNSSNTFSRGQRQRPPVVIPPYFRQDHVQNSSWERPVSSYNQEYAYSPSPMPKMSIPTIEDYNYNYYNNNNRNYYSNDQNSNQYNYFPQSQNDWEQPWNSKVAGQPKERSAYNNTNHYNGSNQSNGHGSRSFVQATGRGFPGRGRGRANYGTCNGKSPGNSAGSSTHKPWITPELLKLIRARNAAEANANATRSPADWYHFKQLRTQVSSARNMAKFDYEIAMGSSKVKTLFYCDPCDKSCLDQESLDVHKAEHMICKLDGCTFTAHPKVVIKHIQMQHATDLYEKIAGYDTPEDIKIWINDRKRMFPTKENIERKRLERLEKYQRGERIHKPSTQKLGTYSLALGKRKNNNAVSERNNELRRKRSGASHRIVTISGNKSEVVTLKSFYGCVKKNSKGVLVGKELTLWTSNTNHQNKKNQPDNNNFKDSGSEAEGEELNGNDCFTDEEEGPSPTEAKKFEGNISVETVTVNFSEVNTIVNGNCVHATIKSDEDLKTNEKTEQVPLSSGLLALVAYSSDSEIEDGEVRDDPEDSQGTITTDVPNGFASTTLNSKFSLNSAEESQAKLEILSEQTIKAEPNIDDYSAQPYKKNLRCPRKFVRKERQRAKEKTADEENGQTESKPVKAKPKVVRKRQRRPLMLEHLLAPEIRMERNGLLQICRFVIANNFFEGSVEQFSSNFSEDEEQQLSKGERETEEDTVEDATSI